MTCTKYWIAASIVFFVGFIMSTLGSVFIEAAAGLYLALLGCGFAAGGWVLWGIGLVNYIRRR